MSCAVVVQLRINMYFKMCAVDHIFFLMWPLQKFLDLASSDYIFILFNNLVMLFFSHKLFFFSVKN